MEPLITLCTLIILLVGLLQIILFFKLWGMTNNVRAIRNRLPGIKFLERARDEYYQGYIQSPKKILDEEMEKRVAYLRAKRKTDKDFPYNNLLERDIKEMRGYYDEMNLIYPDFRKYAKCED